MANVDIKVFEDISIKEKVVFDKFLVDNWGELSEAEAEENKLNFFDNPRIWVVGYKNDRIIGIFLVYERIISFEGKHIKLGGIGGVVTRVDRRRQGIMSQILQKFFSQYVAKYKFDIAMLCTDIKKIGKLYGRVGFVPINRPYYFFDKNGVEKEDMDGMILGLNNKNVVAKILNSKTKLFVGESNF